MSQPDESTSAPDLSEISGESLPGATVTVSPDASRIVLTGEIDLASSVELDQAARRTSQRQEAVVVDVTAVTFMDSIGVGFVAKLIMAGRPHGWRPRLVGAQQQVIETLAISGVLDAVDLVA